MRAIALLLFLAAAWPASAEPTYYQAFDTKRCLHWTITNEMGIDDSDEYRVALALANSQPLSRHKTRTREEEERLSDADRSQMAVIYTASATDPKTKTPILKFGVCRYDAGLSCLNHSDFPLSGAKYKTTRFTGHLPTFECAQGCADRPQRLYDEGYENMDMHVNAKIEKALRSFRRHCQ